MSGPNLSKNDAHAAASSASIWEADGVPGVMGALLIGEEPPDYASFLALVKEAARHLNSFTPPEGFRPEGPAPELTLSPEKARDLGTGSLRDFFSLALADDDEIKALAGREGQAPQCFPRGPESVKPVFQFIEDKSAKLAKAISELRRSWPAGEPGLDSAIRPLESSLASLKESRAGLIRVARDLWPRMKLEALVWPKDAKRLWQKSQSLKQSVNYLLKTAREGGAEAGPPSAGERGRRSLTKAMGEMKNQVAEARAWLERQEAWNAEMERLSSDLDDCLAVAADGAQAERDWRADNRWLTGRYNELEQENRRLKEDCARLVPALRRALDALVETETRLSGRQGGETLEGLETVGRGVQALWRSTIERRQQMARIYFFLPSRLGRPLFLEKALMASAQALGRTQALLEDLRHRLSLAGSRLSTTHRLRSDGRQLAESLKRPASRSARLKAARKRLGSLDGVVRQRLSLQATRGELKGALAREEENELEISRGRAENSRIYRELKAVALERDQLADQLARARQKLKEAGLVKARLLKVFAHKSAIWEDIEQSRQRLLAENETLRAEREALRRKRSQLADLFTRERRELKALSAELKTVKDDLAATQKYAEQRVELEKRLQETKDERQAIDERRREVEARLEEQAAQLAAARAQAEAMEAELARHREELAEASRARLTLGEKAAALRRRQDLMAQAHDSLRQTLQRKNRRLARTETERDGLVVRLNRQKRNLLRLVTTRQELRAELGAARLKLSDLENTRQSLFAQLEEAQAEASAIGSRLTDAEGRNLGLTEELKGLAKDRAFVADLLAESEKEREGLFGRLAESEKEKGDLSGRLSEAEKEKEDLSGRLTASEKEKGDLSGRLSEAEKEKEDLFGRLSASEKEKDDLSGRLTASEKEKEGLSGRLAETEKEKERLAGRLAELNQESGGLAERLAALGEEKESLAAILDEGGEGGGLKDRLEALVEERNILSARLEGLTDEKNRLAFHLADLERRNEEFSAQLEQLRAGVSEDLIPFVQTMGQALWQSELQLKRVRGASNLMADRVQFEAEVNEANLRLKFAGRELEIVEAGRAAAADLESRLAARDSELASMRRQRDELHESGQKLEDRNQRLRQAVGILKGRKNDLKDLLESQGRELEDQKARLAELEPLVAHFFEAAGKSGPNLPGPAADPDILGYLREHSRIVSEELNLQADGQSDGPGRFPLDEVSPADSPLVAKLKARLEEMGPLVAFLARSFVSGVADLAQARQERSQLSEELARLRQSGELMDQELQKSRGQSEALSQDLARARQQTSVLSGQLNMANSTKTILENSLMSRETELAEVRDQAFALSRERDQLRQALSEKKDEVGALKTELAQADRDLTENDGRLEAAWAAMNYLGARAGDSLGSLKSKLDGQARQIDSLTLELQKRESVIKTLEERQDKLALLYWALVSKAAASSSSAPLPLTLADDDDFGDLEVPLELELEDEPRTASGDRPAESADNAGKSGGHSLGRGILEGVKKVARRSLFTLILAGGLVLSGPALPVSPAALGSGGAALPAPGGDEASIRYLSRLDSTYIGRTVSLDKVDPALRSSGRAAIESRLSDMVSEIAASHDLTNGEFLRLVRTVKGPEQTVYLDDFKGPDGALMLLGGHLPSLARRLALLPADQKLGAVKLTALMKAASDFKNQEGGYWERLYFDFLAFEPDQALENLLGRLDEKKNQSAAARTEFAGRLAPFSEVENLGPERFVTFMAEHITEDWPSFAGRNRGRAARHLAADIYFAARNFKLPATLLAALIHQEAEADGVDFFIRGATLGLHNRAADLADLTGGFTRVWLEGRPPLCDLDEALAASERETFVEAVYRKKMALVMAYNKSMNAGSNLFPDLDDE